MAGVSEASGNDTIHIDLKSQQRKKKKELSDIIGEMDKAKISSSHPEDEEDLLALMDQAK